ncbi:MAG: hypothetical protein QF464_19925, partial [Myxococcota bacterium]|nr:hypothetical protein [Myxococcota bacterium]
MERLRVASVPGPRGASWLVFVEIPDPWARRSVLSQLGPHLVTHERVLGYPIRSLKSDPRWLPWTDQNEPLRFVELGPVDAIHELIHARVAGRSQPLRKRAGFPVEDAAIRDAANWSFIAPGAAYELLAASGWAGDADPVALRGLVLNLMRAMTISGDVAEGDDVLTAQLHVERSHLLARLRHALAPVSETLLRQLPDDADVSFVLSIGSIDELLRIATDLATEGLGPLAALGVEPRQLSRVLLQAVDAFNGVEGMPPQDALTGEVVAVHLPRPPGPVGRDTNRWVFALRVHDDAAADEYFEHVLTALLGPVWTYGALYDAGVEPPLHIVREARLWSESEDAAATPLHRFVWRVSNGWLVIANSEPLLDGFKPHDPGPLAGPVQLAHQRAVRSLRRDSPIVILASPQQLASAIGSHWSDVLLAPLADS